MHSDGRDGDDPLSESRTLSELLDSDCYIQNSDIERSVTDLLSRSEYRCDSESGDFGEFAWTVPLHSQSSSRSVSNTLAEGIQLNVLCTENSESKPASAEFLLGALYRVNNSQPSSRTNSRVEDGRTLSSKLLHQVAVNLQQSSETSEINDSQDALPGFDFDQIDWGQLGDIPADDIEAKLIAGPNEGSVQITLVPNTEEARESLQRRYDAIHLEKRTLEQEAHNIPYRAPQDARTTSGRPFPEPTGFQETSISTGICYIFPSVPRHEHHGLINVELLAQHFPRGRLKMEWTTSQMTYDIEADIEQASSSKDLIESRSKTPKGGVGTCQVGSKGHNKEDKLCEISMRLLPHGGDKVVLKVWQGGRTQICGCRSFEAVMKANILLQHALLSAPRVSSAADGNSSGNVLCLSDVDWQLLHAQPVEPRVEKLVIIGSFDVGLHKVGVRLRPAELCRYLVSHHGDVFARVEPMGSSKKAGGGGEVDGCIGDVCDVAAGDVVSSDGDAAPAAMAGSKAPASRFKILKLYIKRSSIDSGRSRGGGGGTAAAAQDQGKTFYCNLYESGVCNVLGGVQSVEMGRELAWVVSQLLVKAFNVDALREPLTGSSAPKRQRRS